MVKSTQRLGSARSPLTAEELLEALEDPRFAVRFEAVVAIGRRPRFRSAAGGHAGGGDGEGPEPALDALAAWALGRMGDPAGGATLEKDLIRATAQCRPTAAARWASSTTTLSSRSTWSGCEARPTRGSGGARVNTGTDAGRGGNGARAGAAGRGQQPILASRAGAGRPRASSATKRISSNCCARQQGEDRGNQAPRWRRPCWLCTNG